jgi:hypothetical protein
MDIDQPGRDVQARNVHRFHSGGWIQMFGNCRYAAIQDGEIADGADLVLGVDHASALQEQIVARLTKSTRDEAQKDEQSR